jgi:hypothetical protein
MKLTSNPLPGRWVKDWYKIKEVVKIMGHGGQVRGDRPFRSVASARSSCPCVRESSGASAEAIASLEPVVQNRQDCPEDSGHWELARMRSPIQLGKQRSRTVLHTSRKTQNLLLVLRP